MVVDASEVIFFCGGGVSYLHTKRSLIVIVNNASSYFPYCLVSGTVVYPVFRHIIDKYNTGVHVQAHVYLCASSICECMVKRVPYLEAKNNFQCLLLFFPFCSHYVCCEKQRQEEATLCTLH